ncbi:MAG: NAD-dependent epimerase/dehydratase family protein [Cyclobacteriaceae bacterium]|nr:NAD-dependent epimerase/dehydratase family protein [Cyclobacteriaceae bacterium]
MTKTALIAGVTGLIGKQLLQLLLVDDGYSKIVSISRRSTGIQHEKLKEVIISFDRMNDVVDKLVADDVFICLGSTMKKAGSKEVFEQFDYTYPFQLATISLENGAKQLSIISALGADSTSSFFYNRVKGELESAIMGLTYETINILRPSLLIGEREEVRTIENIAQKFYKSLGWVFVGSAKKYKAIESETVAMAMLNIAQSNNLGITIYNSDEIAARA